MRLLRAKAARKTLAFYRVAFGMEAPYTVLVDGTFVHHAVATVKTNLPGRLEKLLGHGVKYAVPAAVLDELRTLGAAGKPALEFCERRCEVLGAPAGYDAAAAVRHLVGESNERRYVVATNDYELQKRVRGISGAPLIYFTSTVLVVDPPSRASLRSARSNERGTAHVTEDEAALARKLRRAQKAAAAPPAVVGPRRSKKRRRH